MAKETPVNSSNMYWHPFESIKRKLRELLLRVIENVKTEGDDGGEIRRTNKPPLLFAGPQTASSSLNKPKPPPFHITNNTHYLNTYYTNDTYMYLRSIYKCMYYLHSFTLRPLSNKILIEAVDETKL